MPSLSFVRCEAEYDIFGAVFKGKMKVAAFMVAEFWEFRRSLSSGIRTITLAGVTIVAA